MIKIENIGKVFNAHSRNRNEVLKGVSFELPEKGFIAIYGKSGSGKTTLLNIIGGLDRQDSGKIYIDGENVAGKVDKIRNAKIGFIFQNYYLERGYTIAEIMKNAMHIAGFKDEAEIERRSEEVLALVDMERFKNKQGDALSGGQKQRVAIARALIKGADVILADEPTGNLDAENTMKVMDILKEISKTKLVVVVTHEITLIKKYADSYIKLVDGRPDENTDLGEVFEYDTEHNNIYVDGTPTGEVKEGALGIEFYGGKPEEKDTIQVFNDNGSIYMYDSGTLEEDTNGALLGAAASATGYLNAENYLDELLRDYYLHTSSGDYRFALSSYRLYLDGISSEYSAKEMTEERAQQLWQSISQSNFAVLTLNYMRGEHSFTMRYIARITFSGNRDFRSVDEEDYFTGYEYTFIRPYVYDMAGNSLGALSVNAAKYASLDSNEVLNNVQSARAVRLSLSGQQYSMIFSEMGKYRLTYMFSISLSSTERVSFTLTQDVYVLDGQGEVSVTYVTDEEHPFSDEIMRDAVDYTFADGSKGYAYTQTYSLLQAIRSLSSSDFAAGRDIFFGWSMEENGSARAASVISAGYSITDFISRFGDSDPTVYAIWDPGITVTAVANGQTQQRTLYMNSSGVYVVDFSKGRFI